MAVEQLPSLPEVPRLLESEGAAFPLLLGLLVGLFLLVFIRGDHGDPKLATAALDGRGDRVRFR